jgi:hypothetical protein
VAIDHEEHGRDSEIGQLHDTRDVGQASSMHVVSKENATAQRRTDKKTGEDHE